ncbi:MAG: hypothetical protein ACRDH6_06880 [Actinomycetota bacterium]
MNGHDRQVRYARILGLAFVALGFIAIGLGWNGAARVGCIDCQFPYLLSGGAVGIGLIVFGMGLLLIAQFRSERLKLGQQLEQLSTSFSKGAESNGAKAQTSGDGRVVAGRSTYHLPGCRLVEGKASLQFVTVEGALESGLSPCRVCTPDKSQAKRRSRKKTAAKKS